MAAVLAVLLCGVTTCLCLERPLAEFEVTVPRRLQPKTDEFTDTMLYAVTFGGVKHFIYLEKQNIISANFRLYLNGHLYTSSKELQQLKKNCYYKGSVLGSPNSLVTLRMCSGLRGLLEFSNVSYVIEPFRLLGGFKHLLHQLESRGQYDLQFDDTDVALLRNQTMYDLMISTTYSTKQPPTDQKPRFLKLAMFITKDLFDSFGSSMSAVANDMFQLVSYLNSKFSFLHIHIVVTSLDIWVTSDQVDLLNTTISEKLDRFLSWIHLFGPSAETYDIPVLFTYDSGIDRGLTFFGSICSQQNGALIVFPIDQGIEKFSTLVAHMLGHNIGLMHDNDRDCQCSGTECIMHTNIGNSFGVATFSSCSVADFGKFVSIFGATCLLNEPVLRVPFNPRFCGNRVIDDGEECDCGTAAQCSIDPCCDIHCKLKKNASCAWGACCENCQIVPYGTLCGAVTGECDLPEYCDGLTQICPDDLFQQNGNTCSDHKWYCYNGKCQNPDAQCKEIFGLHSKAADLSCFVQANLRQDRFGNCGSYDKGLYFACTVEDAMCGKLQCTYSNRLPFKSEKAPMIYYSSSTALCVSIDGFHNSDLKDVAFILDGTRCGDDKVCIQQKCTLLSALDYNCSTNATCNSNGICNSQGNCHCFSGWAPPSCTEQGTGGSLHSGSPRGDLERAVTVLNYSLAFGLGFSIPFTIIILAFVIKKGGFRWCKKPQTSDTDSEGWESTSRTSSVTSS